MQYITSNLRFVLCYKDGSFFEVAPASSPLKSLQWLKHVNMVNLPVSSLRQREGADQPYWHLTNIHA